MMRIFELNSSEISWIFIVGMILLAFSLRIMIELMDIKPKSAAFLASVVTVLVNLFWLYNIYGGVKPTIDIFM